MICYTLSDCVLKNVSSDPKNKEIRTDLLNIFAQERSPHKIVIDNAGKIIDIYSEAIENNNPAILYWLQLMADFPRSWQQIDVKNIENLTSSEEIFLETCALTEDKMLIVYHHNGWTKGKYYHKRNINYKNSSIRILDRNEAMNIVSLREEDALFQISEYEKDIQKPIINNTTIYDHSIVAQGGSNIQNAKIK
jgi:hypothetical protein